ncbi:putative nucleotidyltransferase [Dyadobacter sp. BE34]|uniref:Nucleotidyltransferase n=1 Tax=Dyadobacter fermentans TaxID=94254 RepID=A0ABU1QQK7_9BACT|nr:MULTISPECIES: nucleotidyltransferase domain-containing protein [Dyadobacter]MDR6803433.1 putative nucleotidyltransferase [Dyadobacter fermentans]MDR7041174.1 putative nucleotidyltransferase [Dyadobacter sp. BE242]MDR7195577.1 putative nucleotidyltransferase [Dyadobacter sp. BE34]MDR7213878.1 putative nucleotidyltransferase [Dyadobacter sp. BE31]MDR7260984.1 putative nucleotidyltransferase [Dyadobacter sp. BE32]
MKWLENYRAEIESLCSTYKVKTLYAFGSVLTANFTDESDIDLIVDFFDMEVEEYADNYFNFKFALQDLFGRQVDLLEERAKMNPLVRELVNLQKQPVLNHSILP